VSRSFRLKVGFLLIFLTLTWIVIGVEASPLDQEPTSHVVKSGETLSSIAAQYGVSPDAIAQANNIKDPEYVYVSQRLIIPGATQSATTQANPLPAAQVDMPTTVAADTVTPVPAAAILTSPTGSTSDVYTVRSNDTLGGIASRYNTTIDAIAEANGISPLRDIYIGQTLRIPGAVIEPSSQFPAAVLTGAPAMISTPAVVATPGSPVTYLVQPNDTLSLIAMRYGVTYQELAAVNGVADTGYIYAGQTLTIPGPAPVSAPAASPATPTPLATRAAAMQVAPTPGKGGTYTIQPSDTLGAVADRLGVELAVLARMNNISRPSLIAPGKVLTVPRVGSPGNPPWGEKKIEVDVSMQHMFVWEGEVLVKHFIISTGIGATRTRLGTFHVKSKVPVAYSTVYDLYMPSWLGIYDVGTYENGIHGLPTKGATGKQLWAGVLGSPVSFGCVVIGIEDGKWLYDWAEIGTTVVIAD
jgi:LysM repeat protein